jgi:hypothetical protein
MTKRRARPRRPPTRSLHEWTIFAKTPLGLLAFNFASAALPRRRLPFELPHARKKHFRRFVADTFANAQKKICHILFDIWKYYINEFCYRICIDDGIL